MTMASKAEPIQDEEQNIRVETYVFDETQRAQEGRAKMLVLIIILLLTAGYGTWNVWRMVEATRSPVISAKTIERPQLPVPGIVLCGTNINQAVQCYRSAFNAADDDFTQGTPCNEYLSTARIDGTSFVNMRGYYNLTGMFCYIFSPTQPFDNSGFEPLVFNNNTQKIALALYSTDHANNTLGAITDDQWFFFGTFNEHENPIYVKFQIVKIPSISYLYFTRTETVQTLNIDAITGGFTGDGSFDPSALVHIDTSFTNFPISGFAISPNLWGLFRIIPGDYVNNTATSTQVYPVQVLYNRVEFTLLQLAANMGGFVSILSAIYFLLLGSRRVDPWGLVQRYILKSVPPPPPAYVPTVMPYTDVKTEIGSQYDGYSASNASGTPRQQHDNLPYRQGYSSSDEHGILLNDPSRIGIQQPQPQPQSQPQPQLQPPYIQAAQMRTLDPPELQDDFNNDPRYLRLRQELRAEVQLTIAREVGKLRQFLSKYYLKDVIKTE